MSLEPVYKRFPKVPIQRRAAAFVIDFLGVWLASSFVTNILFRGLVFLVLWLGLRVVLVSSNQGQSLGRWALDMKVLDIQFAKIPGLLALAKREGILGFGALIAMIGLSGAFANPLSLLLCVAPLAIDCGIAVADPEAQQAFHDRVATTIVIQTHRGFSLDIRLRRLFAQVRRRMQK